MPVCLLACLLTLALRSAVIVDLNTRAVLARGHNRFAQTGSHVAHGEMEALANLGAVDKALWKDLSVFTTMVPCEMVSGGGGTASGSLAADFASAPVRSSASASPCAWLLSGKRTPAPRSTSCRVACRLSCSRTRRCGK